MSKKANYYAIGLFVIAAGIIGLATVIILGANHFKKNTVKYLVTFRHSANGLLPGSKVKAYGVEIGSVIEVSLHKMRDTGEVVIPVIIEIDTDHLSQLFGYDTVAEWEARHMASEQETGDTYAKLAVQSAVTGQLFIELEYLPKETVGYTLESERFAEYASIPTIPTNMQQMLTSMENIVHNLGGTDIQGMVEEIKGLITDLRGDLDTMNFAKIEANMNTLLTDTRSIVNNPNLGEALESFARVAADLQSLSGKLDTAAGPSLERFSEAMDELALAADNAQNWLNPSNSFYNEVITALEEIGDASRSLRIFFEYAERNPNAFLTGRGPEETTP